MNRYLAASAGMLAVCVFAMFVLFANVGGITVFQQGLTGLYAGQQSVGCGVGTDGGVSVDGLSVEQVTNAAIIVGVGQKLGVPRRGWQIAVATAMQESTLISVGHGDLVGPDSRGLFQQRDSWGPLEVRMDPAGASGLFYARLVVVPRWETLPLYVAAQMVQRSGFPLLYQQWEGFADMLVAKVAGSSTTGCGVTVAGGYALPLPKGRMVSPAPEHHDFPAVDFPVPVGTPVTSVTAGVARTFDEPGGCGWGVVVVNGGQAWMYCHLSVVSVVNGPVVAGGPLGLSGGLPGAAGAGSSSGPHLHVQLRAPGENGPYRCVQRWFDELGAGRVPPDPGGLRTVWPCLVD